MKSPEKSKAYNDAASMVKVLAILSIIFGGMGVLFGILLTLLPPSAYEIRTQLEYTLTLIIIALFWIIPHVFLVFSGIQLLRSPTPRIVKGMAITQIVIGALLNLILLAFAIIVLVQQKAYEAEYTPKHQP